ncbi:MAG: ferredoxin family protein [Pirellulales bacterium]|nr:ferredoxin family protein [Pirellulales bacterium]
MTHVVCQPCFDCKYTNCVVVCPVECFYEGEQLLYIQPDECIDCEACVPECPVEAIYQEDDVPEEWKDFIALNAEMAPKCPSITEQRPPLEGPLCNRRK